MSALGAPLFIRLQQGTGPLRFPSAAWSVSRKLANLSFNGSCSGGGGGSSDGGAGLSTERAYLQCCHLQKQSCRGYARFKFKLDDKRKVKNEETGNSENPEVTEEKSGEEEENKGYWKSHPYRQLDKGWKSKSELAKLLVDNVIHNDHGLFVTNKPFGVGVRSPDPKQLHLHKQKFGTGLSLHLRGITTCPYTLEDCIPELRVLLDKPDLVLCRSTEKFTSGPAVFCDDEATATRFSKSVSSSKAFFDTLYKYHVVTILPPVIMGDPNRVEKLGATIKAAFGTDLGQAVILHQYSINSVKRRDVVPVHCQTKLLRRSVATTASLVELNTSSVAHNFLRVHCADKLAPILGDHLYSDRVQLLKGFPIKVDPTHSVAGNQAQKIPMKVQGCIGLLQPEDSVMVPLHAHLRSYKIRSFFPGDKKVVMEIEAPYPEYFRWTCEQLGIVLDADSILVNNKL